MAEVNLKFCAHCNSHLSVKTWKAHRRLYFDKDTETWIKKTCSCTEEEFDDWEEELHAGNDALQKSSNGSDCDIPPMVDFDDGKDFSAITT